MVKFYQNLVMAAATTLLLSALNSNLLAQTPCQGDYQKGLRKGETYVPPCDSMVVLNKPTFEKLYIQIQWSEELITMKSRYLKLSDESIQLSDSLNKRLKSLIQAQDKALAAYKSNVTRLDTLVNDATTNTRKALNELRRTRLKSFLYSGAATIVGFLVGSALK